MFPKEKIILKTLSNGLVAHCREGSSDERVIKEVVEDRCYRRVRMDFDVEPRESWLDLGANIGAFALYCQGRGAIAECYEPDPDCFALLTKNTAFWCANTAVTNKHERELAFYRGRADQDHYRFTAYPTKGLPEHKTLANVHGSIFSGRTFDGIKMDIEGAEAGLLDDDLLPSCNKLVMEYHTSRDSSMINLKRRLDYLKSRFEVVEYPPEFDRHIAAGPVAKSFFDRLFFCKGKR